MKVTEDDSTHAAMIAEARRQGRLSPEAAAGIERWLDEPQYEGFRQQILSLVDSGDWPELNDAFYTIIPFGTGGRRGRMGVGPNRINQRTIGESTQGLSRYIAGFGPEACARGVVIAYDVGTGRSRHQRQPQSAKRQRLQGLLGRRRSDRQPRRHTHHRGGQPRHRDQQRRPGGSP